MSKWDARYARGEHLNFEPAELLVRAAEWLAPAGRALDLACGAGRHALFLASKGWNVTAVDSSQVGVGLASARARELGLQIEFHVADLEKREFRIQPDGYDLIMVFFYLQRDLFGEIREGVRPGGHVIASIHLRSEDPAADAGRNTAFMLEAGELRGYFRGWEIASYHETLQSEIIATERKRRTAEIIARRPDGAPPELQGRSV